MNPPVFFNRKRLKNPAPFDKGAFPKGYWLAKRQ